MTRMSYFRCSSRHFFIPAAYEENGNIVCAGSRMRTETTRTAAGAVPTIPQPFGGAAAIIASTVPWFVGDASSPGTIDSRPFDHDALRVGVALHTRINKAKAAWLMLRAVQLWAPFPDNDPDGAQARMHELYALVRLRFGEPADPAQAASLEIDWWRAHRKRQYALHPAETGDELVESVTRLYSYLFGKAEAMVRPAAVHRVEAMDLSDQWVREGCPPDSPLLPLEHAALVRAYSALLAAVHQEEPR